MIMKYIKNITFPYFFKRQVAVSEVAINGIYLTEPRIKVYGIPT